MGDLTKGVINMFKKKIQPLQCTAGAAQCPICFTATLQGDSLSLWCGCTVCHDCMKGWVGSQLEGANANCDFFLHCPVCRAIVRPEDARRIMGLDSDLYQVHHEKLLARTLQKDPEFVNCPQCRGGGFINSACLASAEEERASELQLHGRFA